MQLQGLMFMLLILLIIPILAISTNHFVFFAIMSVVVIISSIRKIYSRFLVIEIEGEDDADEETQEEFEDILNINMKKFGTGINVVKNLFVIIFILYCSYYLNSLLLKINASLLILYQVHYIKNILADKDTRRKDLSHFSRNLSVVNGVLSLVLISFTVINVLFKMNF